MAYLDKNQKENILNEILVSKFELLSPLLEIITKNTPITQSELMRKSKYSGGKIYHCVKAMKTMKLVENGNGLKITDLGKVFLMTSNSNKEEFRGVLKTACLNVPLFNKIYNNNREITNARKIFELFNKEIQGRYENINPKFVGAIVRRYLQGLYGIKLPVGHKFRPEEYKNFPYEKILLRKKENQEIIENLKNLKKNLNLSDKDFQHLINSLPEKKREEIFSQIISKVFK